MFNNCKNLTIFTTNSLNSLTNAYSMFSNCSSLETFAYNLSNVTDGRYMFNNCSSLKTFKGSLASLVRRGYRMFYNCKLNKESV